MRQRRFVSPFVIRWPSKTPVQIMVKRNDVLALELNATSFCYRATSGNGGEGERVFVQKAVTAWNCFVSISMKKRKKKEKYLESLKTTTRSRRRKKAPSSRGFLRVEVERT